MKLVRMRCDTGSTRFGLLANHAYHTRYNSKYITGSVLIKFVFILTSEDWICLNCLEISNTYRMDDIEKRRLDFLTMIISMFFLDFNLG